MRAGLLNVLVDLEQPVETQDAFGDPVPTWTLVVRTYATKKVGGSESERFEQRVSKRLPVGEGVGPRNVRHG